MEFCQSEKLGTLEHCGMWTKGWAVNCLLCDHFGMLTRGLGGKLLLCDLLYTLLSLELTILWYSITSVSSFSDTYFLLFFP